MINLKASYTNFIIKQDKDSLIKFFLDFVNEACNMLPQVSLKELYGNDYDLDMMDFKLAYKEYKEFPSEGSVENMLLVIAMIYKGFGLTFQEFCRDCEKIALDKTLK